MPQKNITKGLNFPDRLIILCVKKDFSPCRGFREVWTLVFEQIKALLAEHLGCDEDRITENTVILEDLEADSLDLVEFMMSLEEEYSIEVEDEDLERIKTVGDVVKYIEERI
jgi:acyl carrier protein